MRYLILVTALFVCGCSDGISNSQAGSMFKSLGDSIRESPRYEGETKVYFPPSSNTYHVTPDHSGGYYVRPQ